MLKTYTFTQCSGFSVGMRKCLSNGPVVLLQLLLRYCHELIPHWGGGCLGGGCLGGGGALRATYNYIFDFSFMGREALQNKSADFQGALP